MNKKKLVKIIATSLSFAFTQMSIANESFISIPNEGLVYVQPSSGQTHYPKIQSEYLGRSEQEIFPFQLQFKIKNNKLKSQNFIYKNISIQNYNLTPTTIDEKNCHEVKFVHKSNGSFEVYIPDAKKFVLDGLLKCKFQVISPINLNIPKEKLTFMLTFNYSFEDWLNQNNNFIAEKTAKYLNKSQGEIINSSNFTLNGNQIQKDNNYQEHILDLSSIYKVNFFPNTKKLFIEGFKINSQFASSFAFPSSSIEELDFSKNKIHSIPQYAFKDLNELKHLNLSGNGIENIAEEAFSNIKLESLSLSNNQIKEIKENTFANLPLLKKLEISFNQAALKIHEESIKKLESLIEINLSNSNIYNISPNTFQNLSNLEKINLSNNQIVTEFDFSTLTSLTELNLSYNKIEKFPIFNKKSYIKTSVFNKNIPKKDMSIKKIDLSYNKIKSIYNKNLKKINNLLELDLSNNEINFIRPKIPHNHVYRTHNMNKINLSNNKLDKIPDFIFPNLTEINLANNKIITVNKTDFKCNPNIKEINLSNNNINYISLLPLHNLKKLALNNNKFTIITNNFLSNSKKLNELYLSENPLTHIQDGAFDSLTELTKLHINYNKGNLIDFNENAFSNLINLQVISLQNSIENSALQKARSYFEELQIFPNLGSITINNYSHY